MYFLTAVGQPAAELSEEEKKERKKKRQEKSGGGGGWGGWNGNVALLLESAKLYEEIQIPLAPTPLEACELQPQPSEREVRGPLGPSWVSPTQFSASSNPLPTLRGNGAVLPARRSPQGVAVSMREWSQCQGWSRQTATVGIPRLPCCSGSHGNQTQVKQTYLSQQLKKKCFH